MSENMTTIEIDMEGLPVEILYYLIRESCERNISVNQIITEALQYFLDENEKTIDNHTEEHCEEKLE